MAKTCLSLSPYTSLSLLWIVVTAMSLPDPGITFLFLLVFYARIPFLFTKKLMSSATYSCFSCANHSFFICFCLYTKELFSLIYSLKLARNRCKSLTSRMSWLRYSLNYDMLSINLFLADSAFLSFSSSIRLRCSSVLSMTYRSVSSCFLRVSVACVGEWPSCLGTPVMKMALAT